jgi:hypothetical protein
MIIQSQGLSFKLTKVSKGTVNIEIVKGENASDVVIDPFPERPVEVGEGAHMDGKRVKVKLSSYNLPEDVWEKAFAMLDDS